MSDLNYYSNIEETSWGYTPGKIPKDSLEKTEEEYEEWLESAEVLREQTYQESLVHLEQLIEEELHQGEG